MANSRELVNRRKSVRNTRKITKTMEMVSTAKLAKAQNAALAARPYARKLQQVIGDLAASASEITHPLLETHRVRKKAVVVVMTSDRGLCGAFNANILREVQRLRKELTADGLNVEFFVHGKKAAGWFRYQQIEVSRSFIGVSDKPDYARAESIANDLIARYSEEKIDEAYLVFSQFKSMASQVSQVEKILPLSSLASAAQGQNVKKAAKTDYLYHPDPATILHDVLPLVVRTSVFTAMLDNAAGEHAARRMAMKNATDAADDMIKALTREYNRARQSKITQEIAEIVGGAEAI